MKSHIELSVKLAWSRGFYGRDTHSTMSADIKNQLQVE